MSLFNSVVVYLGSTGNPNKGVFVSDPEIDLSCFPEPGVFPFHHDQWLLFK